MPGILVSTEPKDLLVHPKTGTGHDNLLPEAEVRLEEQ